jgi:hypothetical protein
MYKTHGYILGLFLCFITVLSAAAQEQKTFKESLADLKKAFHPAKAFILPFRDSTNEDLQAFLFAVQTTKGVNGAELKIKNGKAVITVNTKTSMVSVWDNLEKEYRNRYTVTDRTPDGFILADSYQTNATANQGTQSTSQKQNNPPPTTSSQKQNNSHATKPKHR